MNEGRNETYARLAALAEKVKIPKTDVLKLLNVSDKPGEDGSLNIGNGVTDDVKLMVKVSTRLEKGKEMVVQILMMDMAQANRLTGVHVTPTVLFNVSTLLEASSMHSS